jgi:hypothetical protein
LTIRGKSNCHSKCGGCLEVDIENQVQQLPVGNIALPPTELSRETNDSMSSNVTKIVEIQNEKP